MEVKLSILGIESSKPTARFDAGHPMFEYHVDAVPSDIAKLMRSYEHFVVVGLGGSVLPLKVFVSALNLDE